jgi:hypothetical protein
MPRSTAAAKDKPSARRGMSFAAIGGLPPGLVAAPSDVGVSILRFTGNSILSAPYHRNQGGMLTEMHIGLVAARRRRSLPARYGCDCAGLLQGQSADQADRQDQAGWPLRATGKGKRAAYLQALPKPDGSPVQFYRYVPGL